MLLKADPTFYPSPKLAAQAPHEKLAYVAAFNPKNDGKPDALVVVDTDPGSKTYGQMIGRTNMPKSGDELHHFAWHLGYDTAVTSEWGTPNMVESGVIPEQLLAGKYGHSLHFFDLRKRRWFQTVDLGAEYQMVLELRPAHDPTQAYGFAGVVV